MRFEVTTRCNYHCVICPREKLTRKIETMSLRLFKTLFDRIVFETDQYDTLTFPGMGEPLLDKSLEDKIVYARTRKKGLPVLILSNASLLTPERFLAFEDLGVDSIRVSLYGNDEESYSRVHGVKNKRMFEKIREHLLAACSLKKKTKLYLTLNVIEGYNEKIVQGWIAFWKDKADLLEVWRPHNWVDAMTYRKVQKKMLSTCGRPFKGPLQVQVDGTVNMCCFDFDGKLTVGDLKTQTLREIFSSPIFNKIVKCHTNGEFKRSGLICAHCDQRNIDKSDVMIYNSKYNIEDRVKELSTTYKKVI